MKQKNQGFIIPLLIGIIALLAVGGGVYFYLDKSSNTQNINQNENIVATSSDSSANTQATYSENSPAISNQNTPSKIIEFPLPTTPYILRRSCRMDECSWQKIINIETVRNDVYGEMRKIAVAEVGGSYHDPNVDPQYPIEFSQDIPIEWRKTEYDFYVLCSKKYPYIIYKNIDNTYTAYKLNIVNPFGMEYGSTNEYLKACHNTTQDKETTNNLVALGYPNNSIIDSDPDVGLKIISIEELHEKLK